MRATWTRTGPDTDVEGTGDEDSRYVDPDPVDRTPKRK
jgi:hypothetical protein